VKRAALVVFAVLLAVQAAVLAGCSAVATLACDRPQNSCTLTTGPVWARNTTRFPVSDIVRARVDERRSTDSEGTEMVSREVVLGLKAGAFPFGMYESLSWQKAQPTVDRINTFLDAPQQQSLVATQDSRPKVFLFSSVFIWGMPVSLGVVLLFSWLGKR
jgi:hypothetical protein